MPRLLSPLERMIDTAVRCVRCGATRAECACYRQCRCGRSVVKGEACDNPLHAVEEEAAAKAKAVATAVVSRMSQAYPQPMQHASGGFKKTLRGYIEAEVAQALVDASPHAPTAEQKQAAHDELEAAIALFRRGDAA